MIHKTSRVLAAASFQPCGQNPSIGAIPLEYCVLAKTVDSVEMLKKRTTLEKRRTHCEEREEEEDSHVVPSSVPVGRQFQRLARKVCFRLQDLKIEKIRGQLQECPSPQSLHLLPRSPSPCRRPSPSPPATTPHPRP